MSEKPKFLVRCNCDEFNACADEHVEPGMVAAKCDECHEAPVVQVGEEVFLCDTCANPCWKCAGVGCSACGETGSETKRRSLQERAELPAFTGTWMGRVLAKVDRCGFDEEPTKDIPVETMREAVSR